MRNTRTRSSTDIATCEATMLNEAAKYGLTTQWMGFYRPYLLATQNAGGPAARAPRSPRRGASGTAAPRISNNQKVLTVLQKGGKTGRTRAQIRTEAGITQVQTDQAISSLTTTKRIHRSGSGVSAHYIFGADPGAAPRARAARPTAAAKTARKAAPRSRSSTAKITNESFYDNVVGGINTMDGMRTKYGTSVRANHIGKAAANNKKLDKIVGAGTLTDPWRPTPQALRATG